MLFTAVPRPSSCSRKTSSVVKQTSTLQEARWCRQAASPCAMRYFREFDAAIDGVAVQMGEGALPSRPAQLLRDQDFMSSTRSDAGASLYPAPAPVKGNERNTPSRICSLPAANPATDQAHIPQSSAAIRTARSAAVDIHVRWLAISDLAPASRAGQTGIVWLRPGGGWRLCGPVCRYWHMFVFFQRAAATSLQAAASSCRRIAAASIAGCADRRKSVRLDVTQWSAGAAGRVRALSLDCAHVGGTAALIRSPLAAPLWGSCLLLLSRVVALAGNPWNFPGWMGQQPA